MEEYIFVVVFSACHSKPFAEIRQNICAEYIKIFVSNITVLANFWDTLWMEKEDTRVQPD